MNAHLSQSTHSDCFRCAAAEINFAALYEWPAVIDPNYHRPAIPRVCHLHSGAEAPPER
jgi:hypothetical protein